MTGSAKVWRWAALASSAVLSAIVFWGPDPDRTLRSALAIHDFGHVVAFGLVSALFAFALSVQTLPTSLRRVRATSLSAVAATLVGIAVEFAQAASGGNGDPWDMVRNGGGALSAALLIIALDRVLTARVSALLGSVAAIIFIAFSLPILAALQDEARAREQFPVLASFERTSELSRFNLDQRTRPRIVSIVDAKGHATSGLQVNLPSGKYPGVALRYFPRDWSDRRALQLLVLNPDPSAVNIRVSIYDAAYQDALDLDDRYDQAFLLQPGKNQIEIPLRDVLMSAARAAF